MILSSYKILDSVLMLDGGNRKYNFTIHDLPPNDQPRNKLINQGPEVLSIQELLSIILNTGTSKENVIEMTNRIIHDYGKKSLLSEINPTKISKEMSIPIVKACQIVACGELGRRFYSKNDSGFTIIRTAKDVYECLQDMRNLSKEHLRGLYLNSHNKIIRDEVISIGTVNSNMIHPREVFRPAIECNAAALVLAHNHPSGEVAPSTEDVEVTRQLVQAGKIIGIHVLDHVIIAKNTFVSIGEDY